MGIIENAIKSQIQIVDNPTYPIVDQNKMVAFQKETANQGLQEVSPDVLSLGLAALTRPFIARNVARLPEYISNDRLQQGLSAIGNTK